MIAPGFGVPDDRKRRYGTCHRCGWKGSVARVDRHDRKRLRTGRTFGRLCEECASELLETQALPGEAKPGRRKFVRNRHVA